MHIINRSILLKLGWRLRAIDRFKAQPLAVQAEQFKLVSSNENEYLAGFGKITSYEDFRAKVPVVEYDEISPSIERVRAGERDLMWTGSPVRWAAKSSGTTAAVSKFIPITKRYLNNCHYRGGRDTVALFINNFPESKALTGRALTLGGSAAIEREGGLKVGDLSAILIENTPPPTSWIREPKTSIALIADFEEKVDAICRSTAKKNMTSFAGVPSWNLILMQHLLDYTGKSNIHEVWPNMSLFVHGGIAFAPYRDEYKKIFPGEQMHYMETYNASEGFFALQDDLSDTSMLLMLDYEIFYEFLPMSSLFDHSTIVPLEGVQLGVNYAMIITTSNGLWRYMIGDTVEFTSLNPYKIRITGRTKSFINAFGEEVIVDNAVNAVKAASDTTGALVREFTAAPIFMEGKEKGAHEWVVECIIDEDKKGLFAEVLDKTLQEVNSDYAAKRYNCATLNPPKVHFAPEGTFTKWMQSRGKLGGQNKVPRLSGERTYVEQLLEFIDC
ncbi:MAG: GH3 auxin-responsive promoter family protein [Rikenellaceae bacterium]